MPFNLQYIRTSNKCVQKMCRGFNSHYEHLARHFSWLSNSNSLEGAVEENLYQQLEYLEQYLLHVDPSLEFKEKLSEIEEDMQTNYDGSRTFKDVQILVSCFRSYLDFPTKKHQHFFWMKRIVK